MKYNSYGFWTSLAAGLVMLAASAKKAFGIEISEQVITDIVMGIAGVLVVFGVVKMPKTKRAKGQEEPEANASEYIGKQTKQPSKNSGKTKQEARDKPSSN